MKKDRQLNLWKSRRKAPAPRLQPEAPPRLVLGDPDSIAFKRSRQEEEDRRQRLRSEEQRRAHIAESMRFVAEQQRARYPDRDSVRAVLARVLSAPEEGMPRSRERVEEIVQGELARAGTPSPLAHVHGVLDAALAAGQARYQGRHWRWVEEAPLLPSPEAVPRATADHAAAATVVIRAPAGDGAATPLGRATLVAVGLEPGLLTALSVWEAAKETRRSFEILLGDGTVLELEPEILEPSGVVALPGVRGEYGPDIAFLSLPGMTRWVLTRHGHRLHGPLADAEPPLGGRRIWFLGAGSDAVDVRSHVRSADGAHDYVDLGLDTPGHALPGTGVWSVTLDDGGEPTSPALLEGVVFRHVPGGVRCHGRRSIATCVPRPRDGRS